jgi:hypothetical protein
LGQDAPSCPHGCMRAHRLDMLALHQRAQCRRESNCIKDYVIKTCECLFSRELHRDKLPIMSVILRAT